MKHETRLQQTRPNLTQSCDYILVGSYIGLGQERMFSILGRVRYHENSTWPITPLAVAVASPSHSIIEAWYNFYQKHVILNKIFK